MIQFMENLKLMWDSMINIWLSIKTNSDYTTNKGIPSGCEVEIFTKRCLLDLNKYAIDPNGTEYLTNYITDNPNEFKISYLKIPKQFKKNFRLTIDTKNDFLVVKKILEHFKNLDFSLRELIAYCNKNKMLFKKYKQIKQKKIPHFFSTKMKWGKWFNNDKKKWKSYNIFT